MTWSTRYAAALALQLMTALTATASAQAQSGDDIERAKQSFQAGATAYAAGEFRAAIQALEAAYALTPLPAIAFSLAQAERRQYFISHERPHLDRAVTLFRRYLDQVPTGGRRADAAEALSQLVPLQVQAGAEAAGTAAGQEQAAPTRLMVTSETPEATVSLDGSPPVPSPLIREVAAGAHQVSVTAPGFFSDRRELVAVAGELIPAVVNLRERPSALAISAPDGAEIYVDGAYVGRGGGPIKLPLPGGGHRLAVGKKGHRVAVQSLSVSRGQSSSVSVELQPSRQRKASWIVLAGAAGALGAGTLLTGLSLRAQQQAEDFLELRARGNVTANQLAQYNEALHRRDLYRTAAVSSFAVMTAAAVTGLLLHQLDHPDPELLRRVPASDERQGPDGRPVQISPLISLHGRGAGARVHGRF